MLKVLKFKVFPFFCGFSICHGIFYLLFNFILSNKKFKFNIISMDFLPFFLVLYNVSFKCKYKNL